MKNRFIVPDKSCKVLTCWMCKHFRFESGFAGYSNHTPGYDAKIECEKGVYRAININTIEKDEFIETLQKAGTCDHFQNHK